jgi:hypothetical protein
MELPKPEGDQISAVSQMEEKKVNQLSEELHLFKQHVDGQFARQRESADSQSARIELLIECERERAGRLIAEFKIELVELINRKFDEVRRDADTKLADLRKDMDRKFMCMMAGLVGVIAGQVALFFR